MIGLPILLVFGHAFEKLFHIGGIWTYWLRLSSNQGFYDHKHEWHALSSLAAWRVLAGCSRWLDWRWRRNISNNQICRPAGGLGALFIWLPEPRTERLQEILVVTMECWVRIKNHGILFLILLESWNNRNTLVIYETWNVCSKGKKPTFTFSL